MKQYIEEFDNGTENDPVEEEDTLPSIPITDPEEEKGQE